MHNKQKYQFDKLRNRKSGYPMATVAYYGPDDQFSSKVVVGIIWSENQKEPTLKKWFAKDQDVRRDEIITEEIFEYINSNHVHRVAMVDSIIGCPHEEGVDYPDGDTCPLCPFWANRDRWTGKIYYQ